MMRHNGSRPRDRARPQPEREEFVPQQRLRGQRTCLVLGNGANSHAANVHAAPFARRAEEAAQGKSARPSSTRPPEKASLPKSGTITADNKLLSKRLGHNAGLAEAERISQRRESLTAVDPVIAEPRRRYYGCDFDQGRSGTPRRAPDGYRDYFARGDGSD